MDAVGPGVGTTGKPGGVEGGDEFASPDFRRKTNELRLEKKFLLEAEVIYCIVPGQ